MGFEFHGFSFLLNQNASNVINRALQQLCELAPQNIYTLTDENDIT